MSQFTALLPRPLGEQASRDGVRIADVRLHRAATPVMVAVHQDLGHPEVALLLTDRHGRAIDRWVQGRSSNNAAVEATAVAAALRPHRRPVASGRRDDRMRTVCSAGVVADPATGEVLGAIAVTYPGWMSRALMRALIGRMVHETRQGLPSAAVPAPPWSSLTRAEQNVVHHVALGLTNRETAEKLFVTAHTVDYHLRRVFQKLGLRSRVELAHLVGLASDVDATC